MISRKQRVEKHTCHDGFADDFADDFASDSVLGCRSQRWSPAPVPCGCLVILCSLLWSLLCGPLAAQLQSLSRGNADQQWRDAQLQIFDRQLADATLPDELKLELRAQRKWLADWVPNAPAANARTSPSSETQSSKLASEKRFKEPTLDPEGLAADLRERLFHSKITPTVRDTVALQTALMEHPDDLGLRQLQLHWIDQPRYRDDYWKEIVDAGGRVAALIGELPPSEETKVAAAFANYRKARALAHCLRGRPLRKAKIAGVEKLSTADREQMQNTIGECSRQIEALVGSGHPEFFLLEIYVLQRDGWKGRALEMLERHAGELDPTAYAQARYKLLESLGWSKPATQAAAQVAALPPAAGNSPVLEIEFTPISPPTSPTP